MDTSKYFQIIGRIRSLEFKLTVLLLNLIYLSESQSTTGDTWQHCNTSGLSTSVVLDKLIEDNTSLKILVDRLKAEAERQAKQIEDLLKDLNNTISTRAFVANTDRSPTLERLTTTTTKKSTSSREGCPTGFTNFNNSTGCYKIIIAALNYEEAYNRCTFEHPVGRPAVVESEQEHKSIQKYLFSKPDYDAPCNGGFWIALERKVKNDCNSKFVWKRRNGITTYEEDLTYQGGWGEGEPNCSPLLGSENCGHYYQGLDYNWNDNPCDIKMCGLCEAPPLNLGEGIFPF